MPKHMASILLSIIMLFCVTNLSRARCPNSTDTDPLSITRRMNNATFVYESHSLWVDCCMTGYSYISWSFRKSNISQWHDIGESSTYHLQSKNKTLLITAVDNSTIGDYRCVAWSPDSKSLTHFITIYAADCLGREKPRAYSSRPNCTSEGKNYVANCTGDFGCLGQGQWDVEWFYLDSSDTLQFITSLNDSRIQSKASESVTAEYQLRIQNVTAKDFNKTFLCFVTSVRDSYNNQFEVTIQQCPVKETKIPENKTKVAMTLISVFLCLLVLVIVICVITRHYKYTILYKLLNIRTKDWNRVRDREYDAMLYCDTSPVDSDLSTDIVEALGDGRYNIVTPDNRGGIPDLDHQNEVQGLIDQSAAILIVSPSSDTDLHVLTTIQNIVQGVGHDRITVILPRDRTRTEYNQELLNLTGFKHLNYEPKQGNRRLRREFLCALKLRIQRAKRNCPHEQGILEEGIV